MTSSRKDYYYILGTNPKATLAEIKAAYRKLSMKFHPDKNSGDHFFEERFKEVQEAYETLSDLQKRSTYDSLRLDQAYEQEQVWRKQQELRKREDAIRAKEDQFRREVRNSRSEHSGGPSWLATIRDFEVFTFEFWLCGGLNQIHPGWQRDAKGHGKDVFVRQFDVLTRQFFSAYQLPVFAGEAFVECCSDMDITYPSPNNILPSDINTPLRYMLTTYRLIFASPDGILNIVPLKEIASYVETPRWFGVEVAMTGRFGRIHFASKKGFSPINPHIPSNQFWPRSELVLGLISLREWGNLPVEAREFLGQATIPIAKLP